jgi:hypothetical protein
VINKEEKYHERIKSTFIGRKITEVFYQELDYQTDSEFWEYSIDIHSIDMNIIFRLDNDKLVLIKWDNEFNCYGIGFQQSTELMFNKQLKSINLTDNSKWKELIGKPITEIVVFWDESYSQEMKCIHNEFIAIGKQTPIKLPFTWQMEFGNEKIWISTFEIKEDKTSYSWADHLTVFFTYEEQNHFKLIKNANRQHCVAMS